MNQVAQAETLAAGLPRLLLAAERLAHVVAAGAHGRRRAGTGEAFWQFRDFQEGDEVRRIDWRRSASGERLLLREREAQVPAVCMVQLQDTPGLWFASTPDLPSKRERAALLLLALSCLLLEAGERVALAGVTAPLAGRAALPKLAQALLIERGAAYDDPKARHVVFGDFLAPDPAFGTASGGAVLQVLDPAECDFPYAGRVVFEGFGAPVEAARAQSWQAAYKARLAAQKAAVVAAAQRSGQTALFHRTDAPPATALAALYQALRQA
ncbi:MAG: hypothetical protein B7W99_01840 [Rhodospirillales bacterium 20-58-10]|nr:MAG: hypothetical protein B7W99_01840 [Rhodospirillales bacterium 20-58-10]